MDHKKAFISLRWLFVLIVECALLTPSEFPSSPRPRVSASREQASPRPPTPASEYLWYEAENMRGITEDVRHEPVLNPSWLGLPAAKARGWGINGPGVSAEWSQGGESEWNSVNASADESRGVIWQDIEVPRAGQYRVWARYSDWANKNENFAVRIAQEGHEGFSQEF